MNQINHSDNRNTIELIEPSWDNLIGELRSFDEATLKIPNVIGIWSLKDLIGHLESWDRIAIRKLDYAEQGLTLPWWEIEESPYASIHEFNETDVIENRHKSLTTLWNELEQTHKELVIRISRSAAPIDGAVREDTYDHYIGHREDILAWKADQSTVAEQKPLL